MRKLRALDLFCCAGGMAVGLARAGFEVFGVDIEPQKNYPFQFHQGDALTFPFDGFDYIHASPPCQSYSAMRHAPGAKGAPMLIDQVRARIQSSGVPYSIENVEEARFAMRRPICLCGSMFGLGAQGCQLRRHRLFECSFHVDQPQCAHDDRRPVIGVYGGHARKRAASAGGRKTKDEWVGGHRAAASEAMGITHMTLAEMSEAVPPVYGQYIGHFAALSIIQSRRIAA